MTNKQSISQLAQTLEKLKLDGILFQELMPALDTNSKEVRELFKEKAGVYMAPNTESGMVYKAGVYMAPNTESGMVYIGLTTDLEVRTKAIVALTQRQKKAGRIVIYKTHITETPENLCLL